MADREPFLKRWARQKRASAPALDAPETEAAPPEAAGPPAQTPEAVELPDADSLDRDSDFTVFMREGVSAIARKQALRRLWRLDPLYGELDGLVEYGEDYTAKFGARHAVSTAWRFGRGMPDPAVAEDATAMEDATAAAADPDSGTEDAEERGKDVAGADGGEGETRTAYRAQTRDAS